jgi:hypothetical protein
MPEKGVEMDVGETWWQGKARGNGKVCGFLAIWLVTFSPSLCANHAYAAGGSGLALNASFGGRRNGLVGSSIFRRQRHRLRSERCHILAYCRGFLMLVGYLP